MVKPSWVNNKIKRELTRKQLAKYIGLGFAVSLFLMFLTVPPSNRQAEQANSASPSPSITSTQETQVLGENEASPSGNVDQPNLETVKVTRIIDGDTIEIEGGQRVRYIGIDSPEMSPVECYARQAYDKNSELVLGKTIGLEKDVSETDRYGRLLRYIWLDGKLINEALVAEGYAHASSYPPDVKYQDKFRAAETTARESNRGLWGDVCTSPSPTPKTTTNPSPQSTPIPTQPSTGGTTWACDCSKTCTQISSCAEAQYLLNTCGCKARDADGDGIACDGAPLRCQN